MVLGRERNIIRRELQVWQDRLSHHFSELNCKRSEIPGGVFYAIEHELEPDQLESLRKLFKESLEIGITPAAFSNLYWAVVVVIASDIGLRYDNQGQNYWPEFRSQFGDAFPQDAGAVRTAFKNFYKKFAHAIQPISNDRWGHHFNIIVHPIIHSILSIDAQKDIFELVRDNSFDISDKTLLQIGEMLLKLIEGAGESTRLNQFEGRPEVLGMLTWALIEAAGIEGGQLAQDADFVRSEFFSHKTLKNVIDAMDMDDRQTLINFAPEIRQSANRSKTRNRGLLPPSDLKDRIQTRTSPDNPSIKIFLSSSNSKTSGERLSLNVLFPKISEASSDIWPMLQKQLFIAETSESLPARQLIYSSKQVELKQWPRWYFEPLWYGDISTKVFTPLFVEQWQIFNQGTVLFKESKSGLHRLIKSGYVSPSNSYILATYEQPTQHQIENIGLRQISSSVTDVSFWHLDVPEQATDELKEFLVNNELGLITELMMHPMGLGLLDWDADIANITFTDDFEMFLDFTYSQSKPSRMQLIKTGDSEELQLCHDLKESGIVNLGLLEIGKYLIEVRLPNKDQAEANQPGSAVFTAILNVVSSETRQLVGWSKPELRFLSQPTIQDFLGGNFNFQILDRIPATYQIVANGLDNLGNCLVTESSKKFRVTSHPNLLEILAPIQTSFQGVEDDIYEIKLDIETNGQTFPQNIALLSENKLVKFINDGYSLTLNFRGCTRSDITVNSIPFADPLFFGGRKSPTVSSEFTQPGIYVANFDKITALGILYENLDGFPNHFVYDTSTRFTVTDVFQKIKFVQDNLRKFLAEERYSDLAINFNEALSRQMVLAVLKPSMRDMWVAAEENVEDPQFETQKLCIEYFASLAWVSKEIRQPKTFFCESYQPSLLKNFRKSRFTFFRRLASQIFDTTKANLPPETDSLHRQVMLLESIWHLLLDPINFDLSSAIGDSKESLAPAVLLPVVRSIQLNLAKEGWDGKFK